MISLHVKWVHISLIDFTLNWGYKNKLTFDLFESCFYISYIKNVFFLKKYEYDSGNGNIQLQLIDSKFVINRKNVLEYI